MRRVPLAGRDKLFVLSRARDTEIHRESGTMSPSAARRIYIPRRISRLSMPFIFQPKINERELLLFRKEIIGKIIIEIEKAKRKRTCTCFPASDRDISKYKRINRSIYERRSSRDETSKKKRKNAFIDAFQNEEEKAGETFDSYTDLKNFQQFSRL